MSLMLPPELVREVIAFASCGFTPDNVPEWFHELALVTRAWVYPIQAELFCRLTLGWRVPWEVPSQRKDRQKARLHFLASRSDLAIHVTHLRVYNMVIELDPLKSMLRVIFTSISSAEFHISYDEGIVGALLSAMPRTSDVSLNCYSYRDMFDVQKALHGARRLKNFNVVGNCPWVMETVAELALTTSKDLLQGLTVRYTGVSDPVNLARQMEAVSQFQELRILRLTLDRSLVDCTEAALSEHHVVLRSPSLETVQLSIQEPLNEALPLLRAVFAASSGQLPLLRRLMIECRTPVLPLPLNAVLTDGAQRPVLSPAVVQGLARLQLQIHQVQRKEENMPLIAALFGVESEVLSIT